MGAFLEAEGLLMERLDMPASRLDDLDFFPPPPPTFLAGETGAEAVPPEGWKTS